ncbi:transcription factor pangolin [Brevipalpus obovatus]|uniref:transcription factor pangolin n=1 Tax=Brevipalpus obovatus TaxID=246614 RepID=UPI003D9EA309
MSFAPDEMRVYKDEGEEDRILSETLISNLCSSHSLPLLNTPWSPGFPWSLPFSPSPHLPSPSMGFIRQHLSGHPHQQSNYYPLWTFTSSPASVGLQTWPYSPYSVNQHPHPRYHHLHHHLHSQRVSSSSSPGGPSNVSSANHPRSPPTSPRSSELNIEKIDVDSDHMPDNHVKKPLNAFMLFMKENRAGVVAECTLKESAQINQILGKKWHDLPKEEQARYYAKAQEERQLHLLKYPNWSAKDNYLKIGKKKKKNEKIEGEEKSAHKKCRARYGLEHQVKWCNPCRRKKKCIRFLDNSDEQCQ